MTRAITRASLALAIVGGCAAATLVAVPAAAGGSASGVRATVLPGGGLYTALTPARILDTRTGNGATIAPVAAGQSVVLQVSGRGGVPAAPDPGAVLLNVTVTQPTVSGHVTVYPTGATRPNASNLNFAAKQTVANLVSVALGTDGKVTLYNATRGSLHLVGDVAGWFRSGTPVAPGTYKALTPARILDTRTGNGATKAALGAGQTINLQVAGRGGVPSPGAAAVLLNVTVTQPVKAGHVTVYPTGATRPNASNLNFAAKQTVANLVAVALGGTDGQVTLYNATSGTVHLVADVAGYFVAGATPVFTAPTPARILDTRTGNGAAKAALGAGQTLDLVVSGRGGVPAAGVTSVLLNVTVTQPVKGGHVTVFPTGAARPNASNLNFVTGQTVANLVAVALGTDGKVSLYNATSGTVQLVADVAGYFETPA